MAISNTEKLGMLMDNKDFVTTMLSQESPEDVKKLFADNGVDMSMDDVMQLGADLDHAFRNSEELDESNLENVSGGVVIEAATIWAATKAVIAIGAAGLAIYKWYKSAH